MSAFRPVVFASLFALSSLVAGCSSGSGEQPTASGASGKPAASGAPTASATAKPASGSGYKTLGGKLTLDLPAGADVSDDGSVFGPGKLEMAVYVESEKQAPKTDPAARKEIIKGRSTVKSFTSDATLPDGWLILFEGEKGLGFECGRTIGGTRFVFWGDSSPDEATRTMAVNACKTARN